MTFIDTDNQTHINKIQNTWCSTVLSAVRICQILTDSDHKEIPFVAESLQLQTWTHTPTYVYNNMYMLSPLSVLSFVFRVIYFKMSDHSLCKWVFVFQCVYMQCITVFSHNSQFNITLTLYSHKPTSYLITSIIKAISCCFLYAQVEVNMLSLL